MSLIYWGTLFAIFLCAWSKQPAIRYLELDKAEVVQWVRGGRYSYCYERPKHVSLPESFLKDLVISLDSPSELPWYSVRGVSTDDLHSHLQTVAFTLLNETKTESEPHAVQSILRDLLSSCPNPLLSSQRKTCQMRFSLRGKACIFLTASEDIAVSLTVKEVFNGHYPLRMAAGIALIGLAPILAKSKIFQYSSIMTIFLFVGIALILMTVFRRLSRPRDSVFSLSQVGIFAALLLSYGAAVVWYLQQHLRSLLVQYWEAVLIYLFSTASLGAIATRLLRNNEATKHFVTVLVKWIIRLAGVVAIYNSFPSPLYSLASMAVLAVLYILYEVRKLALRSRNKKKAEKAQ
eukprot:gene4829-5293_t